MSFFLPFARFPAFIVIIMRSHYGDVCSGPGSFAWHLKRIFGKGGKGLPRVMFPLSIEVRRND